MKLSATIGAVLVCAAALAATNAVAATWNTLNGDRPEIIAHRGVPSYLPENSLEGYTLSSQMGADLLETDVQLSKDGIPVLMHDDDLVRTTNVETVFPTRPSYDVSEFTLAELKQLKLKSVDGTSVTSSPVPTLEEFLDLVNDFNAVNGTDVGVLVELKGTYSPAANAAVIDLMIDKGFGETGKKGQVQSFNAQNVAEMADLISQASVDIFVAQLGFGSFPLSGTEAVITDFTFDGTTFTPTDWELLTDLAQYTDAVALFYQLISDDLIDAAHALGLKVYGWTFRASDFQDMNALMQPFLESGLDGFITDQTDLAIQVLNAAQVPLPAAFPLMATGLCVFVVVRTRRRT